MVIVISFCNAILKLQESHLAVCSEAVIYKETKANFNSKQRLTSVKDPIVPAYKCLNSSNSDWGGGLPINVTIVQRSVVASSECILLSFDISGSIT